MTDTAALITAFTTLFVIIDPIGLVPVFLTVTQGMSRTHRRRIAARACFTGAAILLAFAIFGEALLGIIGITMPAFRIAGGVLLFLTALDMLFERRQSRREDRAEEAEEDEHHHDPSVFPLAIPLISGPGAITTIILLTGQASSPAGFAAVIGITFIVIAIVFLMFQLAGQLERALGKTGIVVMTRLFGMLLAALAIQFMLDGLANFGAGLTIIRGGR